MLLGVRPGVGVEITREAVGVIGIITPWNFPLAIPAWKIAPAFGGRKGASYGGREQGRYAMPGMSITVSKLRSCVDAIVADCAFIHVIEPRQKITQRCIA